MNERRFDLLRVAFFCFITLCSQTYCCSTAHAQQDDSRADAPDGDLQFVQEKVLPLLREHCYECHSHRVGKARGGLVLDSLSSILVGGDSGPAVEPGNPDSSLLIEAIRFEGLEMPPEGQLDEESIQILIEWIQRQTADLTWSDSQADGGANASPGSMHSSASAQGSISEPHWAFRPLPSATIEASSPSDAIDVLVQRARRSAGVEAVSPADKRTVVLRLFSDLIGLPPTPEQLERMTGEDSPSLDVIVDELLAMPEFGERWGRHWLDVARYSDSNGCSIESNNTHDNAWRYRDYVIAAFNEDKPYDEFIVQQLAGDLLDSVSDMQRSENLIATGFLVMGPKAFGSGFDELEMDVIDEQIDTLGKAALGLSLGCARCHDHKFDPVTTKDYYALAGIFSSTQSVLRAKGWRQGKSWNRVELPVLSKEASQALRAAYEQTQKQAESGELVKQAEEKVEQTRQAIEKLRNEGAEPSAIAHAEEELNLAKRQLANAKNMKTVLPVISPVPVAMGVVDKSKPQDEALRIRGEFDNRGEVVPRRVLPLVQDSSSTDFEVPEEESGRMQLANWLVDEKQGAGSLVARVAVNRIWGRLLGRP
ncbi:MAG: DUF1549 domain-containing protein, partial [bacterium]|nr:DUF1549 domain-containing protein [bacterium]